MSWPLIALAVGYVGFLLGLYVLFDVGARAEGRGANGP